MPLLVAPLMLATVLCKCLPMLMLSLVGLRDALGLLPHDVIIVLLLPKVRWSVWRRINPWVPSGDGSIAGRNALLH